MPEPKANEELIYFIIGIDKLNDRNRTERILEKLLCTFS